MSSRLHEVLLGMGRSCIFVYSVAEDYISNSEFFEVIADVINYSMGTSATVQIVLHIPRDANEGAMYNGSSELQEFKNYLINTVKLLLTDCSQKKSIEFVNEDKAGPVHGPLILAIKTIKE